MPRVLDIFLLSAYFVKYAHYAPCIYTDQFPSQQCNCKFFDSSRELKSNWKTELRQQRSRRTSALIMHVFYLKNMQDPKRLKAISEYINCASSL